MCWGGVALQNNLYVKDYKGKLQTEAKGCRNKASKSAQCFYLSGELASGDTLKRTLTPADPLKVDKDWLRPLISNTFNPLAIMTTQFYHFYADFMSSQLRH